MKSFAILCILAATAYSRRVSADRPCNRKGPRETPRPGPDIPDVEAPESFSWDNVDGKNFLTNMRNQHLPHYCGSCYAFAAISSLSDRIKI